MEDKILMTSPVGNVGYNLVGGDKGDEKYFLLNMSFDLNDPEVAAFYKDMQSHLKNLEKLAPKASKYFSGKIKVDEESNTLFLRMTSHRSPVVYNAEAELIDTPNFLRKGTARVNFLLNIGHAEKFSTNTLYLNMTGIQYLGAVQETASVGASSDPGFGALNNNLDLSLD